MMYQRNCPNCNAEIKYSSKYTLKAGLEKNALCKICRGKESFEKLNNEVKLGLRDNGFKWKSHSSKTIKKLKTVDRSYTKTKEFKEKISNSTKGSNNPMYGRSFYDVWLERYGKKEADKRLKEFKEKQSLNNSGSNNAMYGRPSPKGSGNGWSGWYKDEYFRSIHELCFLVNWVDRFDLKIESAEKKKYGIKYQFNGRERTYFADWIVNCKYLVEIKPKRLWSTPQNREKFKAAKEWCLEQGLIFKVIDCGKIDKDILFSLYETNLVKFNIKYTDKIKNYES